MFTGKRRVIRSPLRPGGRFAFVSSFACPTRTIPVKSVFVIPRFQGGRFEGSLPIEVARDLAAYEELIVALAKHLYLERNRTRQRVPKGFDQGFQLHLDKLEEGSTKAVIASFTVAIGGLLAPDLSYFESARDLVAECVRAKTEDRAVPAAFPRKFLNYFNTFGRSLRQGETVDITPDPAKPAILTPENRKLLVLEGQGFYSADVQLQGTVAKNEWEADRFTLRLLEGTLVDVVLSHTHREDVRTAGGNERTIVSLSGVAQFDASDKLRLVASVSELTTLPNLELALDFEKALPIEPGWLGDDEGKPVDAELQRFVQNAVVSTYPEALPYPHIAPTENGGIYLEWIESPWRVSAEFLPGSSLCELQATNSRERRVLDQDIQTDDPNWHELLYDFVGRFIASVWDSKTT